MLFPWDNHFDNTIGLIFNNLSNTSPLLSLIIITSIIILFPRVNPKGFASLSNSKNDNNNKKNHPFNQILENVETNHCLL